MIFVYAIGVVWLLGKSTLESAKKDKPIYTVYLKIMISHLQLLTIVAAIEYDFPTEIEGILTG